VPAERRRCGRGSALTGTGRRQPRQERSSYIGHAKPLVLQVDRKAPSVAFACKGHRRIAPGQRGRLSRPMQFGSAPS
jgi:hypothetical protein